MSYHYDMEIEQQETESEVASLDAERTRRFFRLLAEDPFITVVVTDDEVRTFSKGINPDHLARIKKVLSDITQERNADGEEEG